MLSQCSVCHPPLENIISGQLVQFWATFTFIFSELLFSLPFFFHFCFCDISGSFMLLWVLCRFFFTGQKNYVHLLPAGSTPSCGWSKAPPNATKHSSFLDSIAGFLNKIVHSKVERSLFLRRDHAIDARSWLGELPFRMCCNSVAQFTRPVWPPGLNQFPHHEWPLWMGLGWN